MICVVGLGYVGLPLAEALSNAGFGVIGFDISSKRIYELKTDKKTTFVVTNQKDTIASLSGIDTYIICVPTPITSAKTPDLYALESATRTVAEWVKNGDLIVYESTVYPGCTKEVCETILKVRNPDINFLLGYSAERINPGDDEHSIDRVTKIIASDTPEGLERMIDIYGKITKIHVAQSIEIAEAAKIIENVQRDVNIALINEFTMLLHKMGISSQEVLEAARTKWNWLDFKPGLVGGHCIGVDPYYLTYKAQELDFHSEMILAGRRTNDGMAKFVASEIVKRLGMDKSVVIYGSTFKKNVGDFRNSKVFDLKQELEEYGYYIDILDPFLENYERPEYVVEGIVYAVDHDAFEPFKNDLRSRLLPTGKIFDLTGTLKDADWCL